MIEENVVCLSTFREKKKAMEAFESENFVKSLEPEEKEMFMTRFSMYAAYDIIEALQDWDIDAEKNPICMRDVMAVIESIKALGYRALGEDYTMQTVSDSIFKFTESEESVMREFLEGIREEIYGDEEDS